MGQLPLHLATRILSRLLPKGEGEALVGDLVEEFEIRAKLTSRAAASRWQLRQLCLSAAPLFWSRLTRAAWISTLGVALLAYLSVIPVEYIVNRVLANSTAAGTFGYLLLGLAIPFPAVVLIAYLAAGLRPRAGIVLGAIMLLMVTIMTLSAHEAVPLWYHIAYFVVGPAATLIGSALRSTRR